VLIDAAKRKVSKYRLDYLQQDKAFLPHHHLAFDLVYLRPLARGIRAVPVLPRSQARNGFSLPPLVRRIRGTRSCVSNAARSSTSITLASASRAPKPARFAWAALLLHVVKLQCKEPGHMPFRMTSMRTGEDNRCALLFLCLPLSSALRYVSRLK
jgi:hypothetical protein